MGLAFSRLFFAGLAAAAAVSTVLRVPIASPKPTLLDMPGWRWKAKGGGPPKRPTDKPALTPFSEDTPDGPAEPATLDARWDWGSTPKDDAADTTDAVEKRRWLKLLDNEEDAPDTSDSVDKRTESTLRGRAGRGRGRGGRRDLGRGRSPVPPPIAAHTPPLLPNVSTFVQSSPRGSSQKASADNYKKQARDAAVEVDEIWTLFSDSEKPGTSDAVEKRAESALRGRNRRGRGGPRARGGRRRLESGRGYVKEDLRPEAWQYGDLEVSDSDGAVKKRDASPGQIWTLFSDSEKPRAGSDEPIEERSPECQYPVEC
ncbi:hypothetical protein CPLU01_10978 [Colletotrichum plurivorum]|uniref:Uncharacterized protein n=1 Tax=Colletotrichum plurivorum TaxID=2175906 RepID=A0A8H6K322_9PEZI|nr:hypothetical protein CPLU01_10978 [Colletotrichum plurivorum]